MLDYALVTRVRMDLEREATRLRSEAMMLRDSDSKAYGQSRAVSHTIVSEACSAAEHALFHVLNTLSTELDDAQAEEALKSHV